MSSTLGKRGLDERAGTNHERSPKRVNVIDTTNQISQNQPDLDQMSTSSSPQDPPMSFRDLGVAESLCEACDALGYKTPTPIQEKSIPLALEGRDLIGLAETGSGKTAAFVIPILQALLSEPQPLHSLIIAPTRELAQQISRSVEALGAVVSARCALLIGGVDMMAQAIALGKRPHVVVATPGRLLDHLENTKGFSLRGLKYLVLDEADRLLDLDFGPVLDKILKILPKRKTYLFSATLSKKVESLQRAALTNPARISTSSTNRQTVLTLLQSYTFIPQKFKDIHFVHLLNERRGQTMIIFTRTINDAQRLSILLRTLGFPAIPLHGQLSQSARLGALNKFRQGDRNLLVATDVAARGLDIPSVDVVVNYDLPSDSATYIHRVGRTARAGKSGAALSFVTQYDVEVWLRIEKALGNKVEEYKVPREEAMVFATRVEDAQRVAVREMKDLHEKRKGREGAVGQRGTKKSREHMDQEDG